MLVDDELSTGTTVANTIAALHRICPRERYVVAALVDLRGADDETRLRAAVEGLGARLDVVALARGEVVLPADVLERGAALVDEVGGAAPAAPDATSWTTAPREVPVVWPHDQPEGARHGLAWEQVTGLERAAAALADRIAVRGAAVHVLGTEEQMAAPLLLGCALADAHPDVAVRYSTTTRSPALAVDDPGCALRTALAFTGPEDGGARFAYNTPAAQQVVVVTDAPAAGPALHGADGLLAALSAQGSDVDLVVLPTVAPRLPPPLHGPAFGSYAADEVSWLLTDLSHAELEAPTADREREIQSGRAHYAESLPIEFQPDDAYYELFHASVRESAARIAHAVGVVSEILLAERGTGHRARLAGPRRDPDRRPGPPLVPAVPRPRRAAPRRLDRPRAGASTRWRCGTSPPTTTRPTSCSSTAGRARARSRASSPPPSTWTTPAPASGSTTRSPCSPTPAGA